jgi:hypothetical protein
MIEFGEDEFEEDAVVSGVFLNTRDHDDDDEDFPKTTWNLYEILDTSWVHIKEVTATIVSYPLREEEETVEEKEDVDEDEEDEVEEEKTHEISWTFHHETGILQIFYNDISSLQKEKDFRGFRIHVSF